MNKREFVLSVLAGTNKRWIKGKDFSELNFRDANLRDADFSGANLRYADLSGANLRYADLRDANLRDANLRDADLSGANLKYANLRYADLSGANLRGANLRGANLRGADLDFSCLPLWCGSLNMKVDTRIRKQLAYHLLAIIGDDKDEFLDDPYKFANEFHRAGEVPILGL